MFMHANLDKIMFMCISLRFTKNGKVLQLNWALYGFCQSPLLWQQKLTGEIKRLSFKKIPQKLCVAQKNRIIYFFYVNDIVVAYKREKEDEVTQIKKSLKQRLTIKKVSKLKWFLDLYVMQNCSKWTIWLF